MAAYIRPQLSDPEKIKLLLNTKPSDYSKQLLSNWLAYKQGKEPLFSSSELEFEIPKEYKTSLSSPVSEDNWNARYASNWTSINTTTVGRYITNNFLFSQTENLRKIIPYFNEPFNSKTIDKIEALMGKLLLEDKITSDEMITFIDKAQWLGYMTTRYIAPSMTIDTLRIPKETKKLKEELLKTDDAKKAANGDVLATARIEKKLLDHAVDIRVNQDPGFDIYQSGARGSITNNYKLTAVMRGAMTNIADKNAYTISLKSLDEGIPVEEMSGYANVMVNASYGRSMETAQGGYVSKQLKAAFQSIAINTDPESDCGSLMTKKVKLDNFEKYAYRYMVVNNELVNINDEVFNLYKNKEVEIRSPLYCKANKFCSRCMGQIYFMLGIKNIGLVSGNLGASIMGAAMKSFHDTSIKIISLKLNDFSKEIFED